MDVSLHGTEASLVEAYWEQLRPLTMKAKLKLASLLTAAAFEEESMKEQQTVSKRRVARVRRKAFCTPSDEELEARFHGMQVPDLPDDPEWAKVIDSNVGKTIKPIEKWL